MISKMNSKIGTKAKYVIISLCPMMIMLAGCAKETVTEEVITPKAIDPWKYLTVFNITNEPILRNFASSATNLARTISIMGIVFSILYMVIKVLFRPNAKQKSEVKEEAIFKAGIAVLVFCVPLVLSIFMDIAKALM